MTAVTLPGKIILARNSLILPFGVQKVQISAPETMENNYHSSY
jgi:hypothetical protein